MTQNEQNLSQFVLELIGTLALGETEISTIDVVRRLHEHDLIDDKILALAEGYVP